jgi:DNA polymerase III delta subunit
MIYILHGEDYPSSRQFITDLLKENNIEKKTELGITDTSPEEVAGILSSVDMFGSTPLLVLNTTKQGRMKVDAYIEVLANVPEETPVVIITERELKSTNAFIKNAQKLGAQIKQFKMEKRSNVFNFVDSVYYGNRKKSYQELKSLILSGDDPFYIFSMLQYGLRSIAYAKFSSAAFNRLPPFMKSKIQKQAESLTKKQVKVLYAYFYKLDRDVKIGKVDPEMLIPMAVEKVLTYV